jgi:dolichol-phosphate mannosyltransferase
MTDTRQLISLCIPVRDEEGNIEALLARLRDLAAAHPKYNFEFLFTDNASDDRTFEMLAQAALSDQRIRVLRFSRNFGFQRSILANYLNARGDAAVQIDADLQDPPELIGDFLRLWEQGHRVVYGIRRRRQENVFLRSCRRFFYRFIDYISDVRLPRDAGDFRLIDRVIIEHLRQYDDRSPYLRGMIAAIGYPQIGIPYDRQTRLAGKSHFNFFRLVALAIDGICSQSIKPLQFITAFGAIVFGASTAYACFYLVWYFFWGGSAPPGFLTIILLILMSTGLNAAFLGIIGEYVGRIYNNGRGEPNVIIERRIEPAPRLYNQQETAARPPKQAAS